MTNNKLSGVQEKIIKKGKEFGATDVGFADIYALKKSPTYEKYVQNPYFNIMERIVWPAEAKSVLVISLEHSVRELELDYWDYKSYHSPGNRKLAKVIKKLKAWLRDELGITGAPLGYRVENGGVLLKDTATLAGLGTIGKNNLLITPEYGPRVRLRAMFLDIEVKATGPIDFSPCDTCHIPCFQACPKDAFQSGVYNRELCNIQLGIDVENEVVVESPENDPVNNNYRIYCRACEIACPVGR